MNESERLQRYKNNREGYDIPCSDLDNELTERIAGLLNHPQIDKYCLVDAYYYDFSVIPRGVQEHLQLWRDAYLIYGISTEGEMITKWVDRWDLDSDDPIVDGKLIHSNKSCDPAIIPEIRQTYDPKLLSTPVPEFFKLFGVP